MGLEVGLDFPILGVGGRHARSRVALSCTETYHGLTSPRAFFLLAVT